MPFLLYFPNFKTLCAWKVAFFDCSYKRNAVTITRTCSGSDVKDSKLKPT